MKRKLLFNFHEDFISSCEEGLSLDDLSARFGISPSHASTLRRKYRLHGRQCFMSSSRSLSVEDKVRVILGIVQKHLTLSQASCEYNVPSSTLSKWRKVYLSTGLKGLTYYFETQMKRYKPQSSASASRTYDEAYVKQLEYELLKARAEVAYLKKLRALIQEEETGRKVKYTPSRD